MDRESEVVEARPQTSEALQRLRKSHTRSWPVKNKTLSLRWGTFDGDFRSGLTIGQSKIYGGKSSNSKHEASQTKLFLWSTFFSFFHFSILVKLSLQMIIEFVEYLEKKTDHRLWNLSYFSEVIVPKDGPAIKIGDAENLRFQLVPKWLTRWRQNRRWSWHTRPCPWRHHSSRRSGSGSTRRWKGWPTMILIDFYVGLRR